MASSWRGARPGGVQDPCGEIEDFTQLRALAVRESLACTLYAILIRLARSALVAAVVQVSLLMLFCRECSPWAGWTDELGPITGQLSTLINGG